MVGEASAFTKGKAFASKMFARPTIFWLVAEGTGVLFVVSYFTKLLFFLSLIALVASLAYRFYVVYKDIPAPFARPKNIFITGATSGIGEYLAYHYARAGAQTLYLTGRNTERLERVAAACRSQPGALSDLVVKGVEVDVTDAAAMRSKLEAADDATPLDCVYANAGVSASTLKDLKYEEMCRQTIDTNVTGIFNTIFPVRDRMKQRKHGQFVIIASIAGIASLPGNHPYAASKAAAISLGQGFRSELGPHGVGVTTICPGFVRSGMTQERQETMGLPFFMETEPAVDIIVRGVEENLDVVVFPFPTALGGWLLRALPFYLHDMVSKQISKIMYKA